MLFDKKPGEVAPPEDERTRQQRLRDQEDARERWNRDLEEGRRQRREKRALAERFREKALEGTPAGRARAALEAGATVFQLVLPLPDSPDAARDPGSEPPANENPADHNAVLNAIESQGWRLEHASYVGRRTAAVGEGETPPGGQHRAAASEEIVGVYIFRRKEL